MWERKGDNLVWDSTVVVYKRGKVFQCRIPKGGTLAGYERKSLGTRDEAEAKQRALDFFATRSTEIDGRSKRQYRDYVWFQDDDEKQANSHLLETCREFGNAFWDDVGARGKNDDGFVRVYIPRRQALLYRRGNVPNGNIIARIRKPNKNGYKTVSLRTTDWTLAFRLTTNEFRELRTLYRKGIPIDSHRFSSLWGKFLSSRKAYITENRYRQFDQTAKRYFFEFFRHINVASVNEDTIDRYWDWRMTYWTEGPGKDRVHPNAALKPSAATLALERDILSQFFSWAARYRYLARKPEIRLPVKMERNRRPAFDVAVFNTFFNDAMGWVREVERDYDRYYRAMSVYFCSFMLFGGLRPKEAKMVKWRNLRTFVDDEGTTQLLISVHPDTKTKGRDCVPLTQTLALLREWNSQAIHTKPTDYVFANYDGTYWEAHGRSIDKMLDRMGVLVDQFGRKRSAYSFRHTYATHRLLNGVSIYNLALNMGTSVEMIEKHYSHVINQMNAVELTKLKKRDHAIIPGREILPEKIQGLLQDTIK